MTFTALMYAMMAGALVALLAALAVEALGSPVTGSRRVRLGAPVSRLPRSRVRQPWDCPRVAESPLDARCAWRWASRRRATPSSCER
jgi:hypothetical protein